MNILLVENQANIVAYWLAEFEQHDDFQVWASVSVVEARRVLQNEAIDVAIVDMGIPFDQDSEDPKKREDSPYNGLRLLKLVEMAGIKAFALTGTTDPKILRAISYPLIEKPVVSFEKEVLGPLRKLRDQMASSTAERSFPTTIK